MSFIAGRYFVKLGGTYIGQTDGVNITYSFSEAAIRGDNLGDSWQDGVYRGGNCFVNLNLMRYSAPVAASLFWPMSGTFGQAGTIGVLGSSLAGVLTLEAAEDTPAELVGSGAPRIITANLAILTPGVPVEFDLTPSLRVVPLQLQLLPYIDGDDSLPHWFKQLSTGASSNPSAVGGFIAGKYDVNYNTGSIGQTDGIRIGWRMHGQPVTGDNYADSVQDYIYRGADVWVSMTLMEYNNAKARQAFWPYDLTSGDETDVGLIGVIGRLNSGLAKALTLTALTGSPAASHLLTIDKAILSPGHQVQLLYEPRLRIVPIRFNCLPQGSPTEWFVSSAP